MTERYASFLATGSGSSSVELDLDGGTAVARVRARWMGQEAPELCELRFAHRTLAAHHGRLELAGVSADGRPVPGLTEEEALLPLFVEYLRLPPTEVQLHPEAQLLAMRPMGYADWTERYELLLLAGDGEGWPEGPLWEHLHGHLDKARLERVDDPDG